MSKNIKKGVSVAGDSFWKTFIRFTCLP